MIPRRIDPEAPESYRRRWRIVRRDSGADVPGDILSADVDSGKVVLANPPAPAKDYDFGPGGFAIVGR